MNIRHDVPPLKVDGVFHSFIKGQRIRIKVRTGYNLVRGDRVPWIAVADTRSGLARVIKVHRHTQKPCDVLHVQKV